MTGKWPEYRRLTPISAMVDRALDRAACGTPCHAPCLLGTQRLRQAAADGLAVLAARILRRRGARHRFGRAGAQALWRAGLCAPRDRAQPLRGGEPQGQGRDLRRGTRRNSRRHQRAGDFLRPRRAEVDSRRGQAPQLLRVRCHLPAGHQGAPRGRNPSPPRPRDRADRPCRTSRGGRHARPIARRRHQAGADRRGGRGLSAERRRASSPT